MAEHPLDLGWMRVLEAVGRLGSLTAAGAELGLSQPAVSYTIRALEDRLGTRLLVRGHRGSTLSPAGSALFAATRAAVEGLDAAAREIRRSGRRPVVRLFTDYGFASFWMMPRVARFRATEPDTEVHIIASAETDPGTAETMDLSVLFGRRSDFPPEAVQIVAERVFPVCSPGFAARHGLPDNRDAFRLLPLLHLDSTPRPRWFGWRDWLAAAGLERRPGTGDLSLNTYGLVMQAAIADQGLALGWTGLVDAALADGTLVAVGPPIERGDGGYWLLPGPALSQPAGRLADWILAEAAGRG